MLLGRQIPVAGQGPGPGVFEEGGGEAVADGLAMLREEGGDPEVRTHAHGFHRGAVPAMPLHRIRPEVLQKEGHATQDVQAGSRLPPEPRAGVRGVDRELAIHVLRHPRAFEGHPALESAEEAADVDSRSGEDLRHEDRSDRSTAVVVGDRGVEIQVAHRPVSAGEDDLAVLEFVEAVEHGFDEADRVTDVQVRDRGAPLAAEDAAVPGAREPGLHEHEDRGILAPVREEGGEADDRGAEGAPVLREHRLPDGLGPGVDVLAVGRALLGEHLAVRGELAGRERAGEQDALDPEVAAEVEDVAQTLDVGPVVLVLLLLLEVVVRGEVDHRGHVPPTEHFVEHGAQSIAVGHVDLVPVDVRVLGGPAARLRAPRETDDLVAPLQRVEEVTPDEPGRAGDDHPGQAHATSVAVRVRT